MQQFGNHRNKTVSILHQLQIQPYGYQPGSGKFSQPRQQGLCTLDAHHVPRNPQGSGGSTGANAQVHKPGSKGVPEYQLGNLVILNGRNIQTCHLSRKLNPKNYGPFQIEKIVSPLAIQLTLPRKWKIHNVFHVSLIEPYWASNFLGPVKPSKVLHEANDIEQSEEYDVNEVMSSTRKGHRILYIIRWLDYPN